MKFRRLRIAWSAFWALASILLIVLWARSYKWNEVFAFPAGGKSYHAQSLCGRIVIGRSEYGKGGAMNVRLYRQPVTNGLREIAHKHENVFGFEYIHSLPPELISVRTPDWFLVIALTTIATLPWIRWRFSIRTLLIALTLVSLVLGVAVYLTTNRL